MRRNSILSFRIDVPRSTGSIEVKSRTPYGVINALSTRLRAHSAIGRASRLCLFFSDDDSGGSVAVAFSVGYRTLRARWKNVKWWLVIAVANGSPTCRLVGRRSPLHLSAPPSGASGYQPAQRAVRSETTTRAWVIGTSHVGSASLPSLTLPRSIARRREMRFLRHVIILNTK